MKAPEACGGGGCRCVGNERGEGEAAEVCDVLAEGRQTCSIEEAAAILGIGRSTAYAAARDGSLPTLRLSHRLLVPTAKLKQMLGLEEER